MPPANYYACECECTKGFSIGAHIQSQDVNVRDAPAGNLIDHAPAGALGTILDGPQQADLNGTSETWWKIHWDTGVQDGWSVQSLLSVVSSDTLVVKDLQVCLPPSLNVNLPGGQAPTPPDITDDCSTSRVAPEFLATTGPLPAGSQCACRATTFPTMWVAECDATCTDPSGVCLVSGSDPEQATPDPLAAGVFTPTSVCQVSGTATIVVAGHEPKKQPNARGLLQIQGKPCPAGQGCQVGMSYQLRADDIEFDSGTIFADDPKFVDLSVSGATQPNAIDLGVLLGFDIGDVRSGTALTSASGRRSGSSDRVVALFRNTQSVALAVNWASKTCRLSGPLVGQIQGDQNEGTLDIHVDVALDGVLVNQPPVASAGRDQTVECTSPAGAQVTLNASGSTDADNNIAFYTWRRGSDTGALVGNPSAVPTRTTRQGLGQTRYFLRVVDDDFAADTASVNVNVLDTTAPAIDCHAPATITPPDAPVSFKATATDTCGAPPAVVIDNVQCFHVKPNGGLEDAWQSCRVTTQGDTITIRNTGGVNGIIRWVTRATDGAGNVGRRTCEVNVGNPGKK